MYAIAPFLVAFCTGMLAAWITIAARQYPRTGFMLSKSRAFWSYLFTYGVLGMLPLFPFGTAEGEGPLGIPYLEITNDYWRAGIIGFLPFAFRSKFAMKVPISIFGKSFNIAPLAPLDELDGWLQGIILTDHLAQIRRITTERAGQYRSLSLKEVTDRIKQNLPKEVRQARAKAFIKELEGPSRTPTTEAAMKLFLVQYGKSSFDAEFPPRKKNPIEREI